MRPEPTVRQAVLLRAIANGLDTSAALVGADLADSRRLADLAALELAGGFGVAPVDSFR